MISLVEIFLINLSSLIFFWCSGNFFYKFFFSSDEILNKENFIEELNKFFLGIIFISFILILINFFIPLSLNLNLIIFSFFIIGSYPDLKKIFYTKFIFFLIITSILSTTLLYKSNNFMPDAGLYHLPFTKIINNEKIIFGLTNLHFRYGHISIIQYLNGFFYNPIFLEKGIVIFPSLLSSIFINYLIFKIFHYTKFNIIYFICFLSLAFSASYLDRYSDYGNDAPAFIFTIMSIILFLEYHYKKKSNKNFYLTSIFTVYSFLIKSFLIILLIIPLTLILKNNIKKLFLSKTSFFLIILLFLWTLKTIINSGCVIYPISKSCFNKFIWADIEKTKYYEEAGEAAAKGYLDLIKQNENNSDKLSYKDFNKNFYWIDIWSKIHLFKVIEKILPYLIFIFLYFSYIIFSSHTKKKNIFKDNHNLLIFFSIIFFIFWFIKFPLYRYGVPFIFLIISMIFLTTIRTEFNNIKLLKINKFLSCLFLVIIFLINFNRIYNNSENSNLPIIVLTKNTNYVEESFNNNFFYNRAYHLCMYNKNLCTHYNTNNSLKIWNNYKFFIPLN